MTHFDKVLKENERIIHYLIHKYKIRDEEGEFFQEGMIALWHATETYDPSKMKLSTYIYSCISNRFLNMIKKDSREYEYLLAWLEQVKMEDLLVEDQLAIDSKLLQDIRGILSENQWRWVVHFVLEEKQIGEIADKYDVTVSAVKSWRKNARLKIRRFLKETEYVE
ncbi:RNA polymerase sigma factor, sigma-70 family [Gracilibacillus ureilyticus]|uniref:RNA polymerase sigma factor, sigma-70 family n=1 Tax=Gracilibacillus ureilyticus TaxID=531814 RepID=A0A1H9RDB2_9BACI|nr:sigma-70 family RNA polymerase sigma factor [Gracilibacillus ureilyticus]SER70730.1 RNA polymerase sigma factor, sigma-70 family [Gracilibacillus ureilyticus]